MSKFFEVTFSYLEPVTSIATIEGESPDDVVNKIRNYFQNVENLEIHEVTLLDETPEETIPPPRGKPNLRLVN